MGWSWDPTRAQVDGLLYFIPVTTDPLKLRYECVRESRQAAAAATDHSCNGEIGLFAWYILLLFD